MSVEPLGEVHPQLRESLARLRPLTFRPWSIGPLRSLFWLFDRSKAVEGVGVVNCELAGPRGKVSVRVYLPEGADAREAEPKPALLWLHRGGLIVGQPEKDDRRCSSFARALDIVVVSVRYGLAPRRPFPAALDDGYAAWTAVSAGLLGEALGSPVRVDPLRVAVGGGSAGGGIAASLVQRIFDSDGPQPRAQLLIYPMLDDRTAARRELDALGHPLWNNRSNHTGWSAYLGREPGAPELPPYAAAARRIEDPRGLAGLPPTWLGVGTLDLFHDECQAYVRALVAKDNACTFERIEGGYHGFPSLAPDTQLAQDFHRAQLAFLREQLAP